MSEFDTIILGAGAAGMMCAAYAHGHTLVIDHTKAAGEKIRVSGGGRCNFTNLHTSSVNFISNNPHFAKSALNRYTQWDFIELVSKYGISYHEKTLGQLFCDTSAKDIIKMLQAEMTKAGAELWLNTSASDIAKTESGFCLTLTHDGKSQFATCKNLVVACGGKSIPKMGATGFGYQIAQQFGLKVTETRAGLVPFTFGDKVMAGLKPLAGVAVDCRAEAGGAQFEEAVLFTHRGMSGPAILQVSSFWRETEAVTLSLLPQVDLLSELRQQRQTYGRRSISNVLGDYLPKRLASYLCEMASVSGNLADFSDIALSALVEKLHNWQLIPSGTEGYRTAEVTVGGVDTEVLSSKTMETKDVPGLYFIGEVVDVTGWLGGYNFQWAWSSGWAAGTAIAAQS
ncbi:NAD(P)/FAD-dependent oxidoreductase [Pseudohalocynthiibacter aestuariivivens]|uniref:NAD(P)/FAD-dependent oxidoreductase n=1 Tax=Pseudohalocynthiibacter aestuariivivens TaxID=1591409 RepID=A0ABV5JA19_9RHOB